MMKMLPEGLLKLVRSTRMRVDALLKRTENRNKPFHARRRLADGLEKLLLLGCAL